MRNGERFNRDSSMVGHREQSFAWHTRHDHRQLFTTIARHNFSGPAMDLLNGAGDGLQACVTSLVTVPIVVAASPHCPSALDADTMKR